MVLGYSRKKTNFVVVKANARRKRYAVVLLAVLSAMLALPAFHVHHSHESLAEVECGACADGLEHAGHLANLQCTHAECPVCQFLSIPFLGVPVFSAGRPILQGLEHPQSPLCRVRIEARCVRSLRAPPAFVRFVS